MEYTHIYDETMSNKRRTEGQGSSVTIHEENLGAILVSLCGGLVELLDAFLLTRKQHGD